MHASKVKISGSKKGPPKILKLYFVNYHLNKHSCKKFPKIKSFFKYGIKIFQLQKKKNQEYKLMIKVFFLINNCHGL